MSKREGVLSWDEYFMSLALLSSQRSKDPATQVGAVIVNKNKRIIGIGYNGFPHGCSDDDLPWGKSGQWEDTKYPFGKFHCKILSFLTDDFSMSCRDERNFEQKSSRVLWFDNLYNVVSMQRMRKADYPIWH